MVTMKVSHSSILALNNTVKVLSFQSPPPSLPQEPAEPGGVNVMYKWRGQADHRYVIIIPAYRLPYIIQTGCWTAPHTDTPLDTLRCIDSSSHAPVYKLLSKAINQSQANYTKRYDYIKANIQPW